MVKVTQIFERAFNYYKIAADLDDSITFTNLGYLYKNGQGVIQNDNEAFKYY